MLSQSTTQNVTNTTDSTNLSTTSVGQTTDFGVTTIDLVTTDFEVDPTTQSEIVLTTVTQEDSTSLGSATRMRCRFFSLEILFLILLVTL